MYFRTSRCSLLILRKCTSDEIAARTSLDSRSNHPQEGDHSLGVLTAAFESEEHHQKFAAQLTELVRELRRFSSDLLIVTNASRGWVELSMHTLPPDAQAVLREIPVVSTAEQKKLVGMRDSKKKTLKEEVLKRWSYSCDFGGGHTGLDDAVLEELDESRQAKRRTQRRSVISIGDGPHDRAALFDLARLFHRDADEWLLIREEETTTYPQHSNLLLKSVKFPVYPSLEELTAAQACLCKNFETLVRRKRDQDWAVSSSVGSNRIMLEPFLQTVFFGERQRIDDFVLDMIRADLADDEARNSLGANMSTETETWLRDFVGLASEVVSSRKSRRGEPEFPFFDQIVSASSDPDCSKSSEFRRRLGQRLDGAVVKWLAPYLRGPAIVFDWDDTLFPSTWFASTYGPTAVLNF